MAVSGLTRNLKFSDGVEVTPPEAVIMDDLQIDTLCYGEETDSTTTGSNQDIAPTKIVYRVTNASLGSIDSIDPSITKVLVLMNATGSPIDLINASGTAGQEIITSTGGNFSQPDGSALYLTYDETASKWRMIGSVGLSDPMTTKGDLIFKNPSNTTSRLALGTEGQILRPNASSELVWENGYATNLIAGLVSTGTQSFGGVKTFTGLTELITSSDSTTAGTIIQRTTSNARDALRIKHNAVSVSSWYAWHAEADSDGTPETIGYLNGGGNIWVKGDCSALTFTDRTPYPKDLETAIDAIKSLGRLPKGEYEERGKHKQVDHKKLHPFIKSSDGEHRDLSAIVSCQNEVIKDLLKRIEALENS